MLRENGENLRKLLGLAVFVATLSFVLWASGTSIYQIEALASAAVAVTVFSVAVFLRTIAGVSLAFTIRLISIPLGLYVSLLSLIQAAEVGYGFIGSFLAIITAGFLFLSCMNERAEEKQFSTNTTTCVLAILLMLLLPVAIFTFLAQFPLLNLWQPFILVLVSGSFISLYLLQDSNKAFSERLVFASAYNVVLQAVIAVMFFIILTGSMNDGSFVINVAIIAFSIIFPLALYLSTLIYAISENSVGDVSKIDIKNWHIVEGYLFFMAMVVAPPSIIEYILSQQG
ncbi:MAG TPA: hypothetical protein EYQ22_16355 [Gammaproteobacteria bacterium]|nr:hypothetical protein [Gammaproteobacteria bacterium]HIK68649.1 hypothetical protein [Pseudomonadales bacterium]